MSEVVVLKCEKGNDLLFLDGHRFEFQQMVTGGTIKRWTCTYRKPGISPCKAFVTTGEMNIPIEISSEHNHNELDLLSVNILKRKTMEDDSEKPMEITHSKLECNKVETVTTTEMGNNHKNLVFPKRTEFPKFPTNIIDVQMYLDMHPPLTTRGEKFVLVNDVLNHIVLFSSPTDLKFLANTQNISMDETSEFCTDFFSQMFIIHVLKNGKHIPLVYLLLPDKSSKTYTIALNHLKSQCFKLNFDYMPNSITHFHTDAAIHRSIQKVFPQTIIEECQCFSIKEWVWNVEAIEAIGREVQCNRTDTEINQLLNPLVGLCLLNPSTFTDYRIIQPSNRPRPTFNVRNNLLEMDHIEASLLYPPTEDKVYYNPTREFLRKFYFSFHSPHPNIFHFTTILKQFQEESYIEQKRLICVPKLLEAFRVGNLTRYEFINAISYVNTKKLD